MERLCGQGPCRAARLRDEIKALDDAYLRE
jgi:hypothetical protein